VIIINTNTRISPIIIVGMHRSGTSMLSRILESLGLFIGYEKDKNNEAIFFQNLNIKILNSAYGDWERAGFLYEKLSESSFRKKWVKELSEKLNSEECKTFLGERLWKKYRSPLRFDKPWGWKDPRNTFTLPLWLEIFPNAKIIHIYRHGVDVANSLIVRFEKRKRKAKKKKIKRVLNLPFRFFRYLVRNKKLPPKESVRFFYLRNLKASRESNLWDTFSLWEEYVDEAFTHVEKLKDNAINLKYEDFLEKPVQSIKKLVQFCNLKTTERDIIEVTSTIDKSRKYAYRNNPSLLEFESKVKNRLKKFNY